MLTDFAGPLLGLLGAFVALLVLPPLFEKLAGWPQLLFRFGTGPVEPSTSLGYASLGPFISIPVTIGSSPQGLVITGSYFPPWRTKHVALVPWSQISQRGTHGSLFGTRFVVAANQEFWLFAKPRVAERLRASLASSGAA